MSARQYVQDHPFSTVLGLWGTVLGGTFLYISKKQLPTQLKIIQARIVAQAGLIVGAVGLGFAAYMDSDKGAAKHATSSWKLRDYSVAPQQAPAAAAPAEAAAAEPQLR